MSRPSRSDKAMIAFHNCTIEYAPQIDDKVSDASTIALALTDRCGREYDALTGAFGYAAFSNDIQRRLFANKRNTTQARIEASLGIVLANRNGRLPSKRE